MQISELALRLLLLFFPGIICFFIVEALTTHKERKPHQVFLLSLIYGVLSYLSYLLLHGIWVTLASIKIGDGKFEAALPNGISFLRSLIDPETRPDLVEIGLVSLVAILVGFFASTAINRKWLHDIAQKLKVTRKFGDPNVWSFAFNAEQVQWVTVRDLQHNFMFAGYILAFSDVEDPAELLLSDVTVYNETTGKELYRADRLYLSRKRDDLTIEFPNPPTESPSKDK